MDKFTIIAGAILELVGLIVIVRLWLRRRMRIIPRILFSVVLLIPFFGLLIYAFLASDLEKNPDRMDFQSDSDAFYGGDGGH
jgi:bacteriorhodopsin